MAMVTTAIEHDIDTIMKWRAEVINEMFGKKPDEDLLAANRSYYMSHIPNAGHIAVTAYVDGKAAGCGGICLYEELPSPDNPSGRCAYLMNIYVKAPFRHLGAGKAIVSRLIEEARHKGCDKIYLETTSEGYPLYKLTGFTTMNDLMKL